MHHLGATVRFADVDPHTGNLDPTAVEDAIGPKTTVIVPVDFAGHPVDYDAFRTLATRRGVRLLADAAHSFGAAFRTQPVGALADATATSFHPVKLLTTGEGGAVFSADDTVIERAMAFRNHGQVPADRHEHPGAPWHREVQHLGLNYRLPDVLCAIGLVQLQKFDAFLERRRAIAATYQAAFADIDTVERPADADDVDHAWHLYVLRVRDPSCRRAFFDALTRRGLGVQVHYEPVPHHPWYEAQGHRRGACPVAEDFAARAVSIPLFPRMQDADVARVITDVRAAATEVL